MAASRPDPGNSAILDVICCKILQLASGAGGKGRGQQCACHARNAERARSTRQHEVRYACRVCAFFRDASHSDDLCKP